MNFNVERKVFLLGCIWSSFPAEFACAHVCVCEQKCQLCFIPLFLEDNDSYLNMSNNLQHIKYLYIHYFISLTFCPFRRRMEVIGYRRHNKDSTLLCWKEQELQSQTQFEFWRLLLLAVGPLVVVFLFGEIELITFTS